jgi:hypothetical protein
MTGFLFCYAFFSFFFPDATRDPADTIDILETEAEARLEYTDNQLCIRLRVLPLHVRVQSLAEQEPCRALQYVHYNNQFLKFSLLLGLDITHTHIHTHTHTHTHTQLGGLFFYCNEPLHHADVSYAGFGPLCPPLHFIPPPPPFSLSPSHPLLPLFCTSFLYYTLLCSAVALSKHSICIYICIYVCVCVFVCVCA